MNHEQASILAEALETEGTLSTEAWKTADLPFELWLRYAQLDTGTRLRFYAQINALAVGS